MRIVTSTQRTCLMYIYSVATSNVLSLSSGAIKPNCDVLGVKSLEVALPEIFLLLVVHIFLLLS